MPSSESSTLIYPPYPAAIGWCPTDDASLQTSLSLHLQQQAPGLVLDIGSYDGSNAIMYARSGGHRVYAFEPMLAKVARIRKRVWQLGLSANISTFALALANYTGTTTLWVDSAKQDGESQRDQMSKPKWKAHPISIQVDTLDNVLGSTAIVAFCKIDAQGRDPDVLAGAGHLLASKRLRVVAFEVFPGVSSIGAYVQAVERLAQLGYRCYDCPQPGWSNGRIRERTRVTEPRTVESVVTALRRYRTARAPWGTWINFVCMPT